MGRPAYPFLLDIGPVSADMSLEELHNRGGLMTSSIFNGDVTVPGEAGGLSASLMLDAGEVTLTTESDVLGTWAEDQYEVQPTTEGEFRLTLGGEDLLFRPEAPAEFAMAVLSPGIPVPLSEEDAHHELWKEPTPDGELSPLEVPPVMSEPESPPATAEEEPEQAAMSSDDAVIDEVIASLPTVASDLETGLDDGIITAGFLRAIVVLSAVLITFAIVAILLI